MSAAPRRRHLLAALLALGGSAHADTIDVITGTTLCSYEGHTLYVQQAGSIGAARFWAASGTTSKVRPGFGSGATAPVGDWSVQVITADSVLVLTAERCRVGSIQIGGGDEPHWTFACDDVEVAP